MAVSTTLNSVAPARAQSADLPAPLAGLILAAAGMAQRWRRQTRQRVHLVRSKRAQKLAQAKRNERDRLPPASRRRSAAHFEALALESVAGALCAASIGDTVMAEEHAAEAHWFAAQAQDLALWGAQA